MHFEISQTHARLAYQFTPLNFVVFVIKYLFRFENKQTAQIQPSKTLIYGILLKYRNKMLLNLQYHSYRM